MQNLCHISLVILYEAVTQYRLDTLYAKHWQSLAFFRRHAIKAVDRTTYDTTSDDHPSGGLTVVFGGDLHQILPVVAMAS